MMSPMTTSPAVSTPTAPPALAVCEERITSIQRRLATAEDYRRRPGAGLAELDECELLREELRAAIAVRDERLRFDEQRDEREAAHAGEIEAMESKVLASQQRVRVAYAAMQQAVVGLIDAVRGHADTVQAVHERLTALELPAATREGARADGSGHVRDAVRLRGTWHPFPSTASVVMVALIRAIRARGDAHVLAGLGLASWESPDRVHAARRVMGELPEAPAADLPPAGPARRTVVTRAAMDERPETTDVPYLMRLIRR